MKPDTPQALEFLRRFHNSAPWALTAISTDKKVIETMTFMPGERDAAEGWIEKHNGKLNLYFHVNPVRSLVKKKAVREDIASLSWLHVDIDPRPGEEIPEEQERALRLLTDKLPKDVPPPTVIIFSGGGYQGFWKLVEPLELDGTEEEFERAKLWNKQLEILFGGDNCHNIDRIMRLPGTINIPDAKKAKKGRTKALAKVVEFNDNEYLLDAFRAAKEVQLQTPGGGWGDRPNARPDVSGNVARVNSLEELNEWNVPDRVKIIIAQGRHPDEKKEGDNSRSAWVFDAVCQLVRHKVPDEVVFSIITDPEWGIAESILEAGSAAQRYAMRQITRAHEYAINPVLTKLNDEFAVIGNLGGRCVVAEEIFSDSLKRSELTFQTLDAFCNRFEATYVQVGTDENGKAIYMPAGKWWRKNPERRQYRTVVFSPGKEVKDAYNLWQGFACNAVPGDLHESYLGHIKDNLCSGDEELFLYVVKWMARAVQEPDRPGETAIVLKGGRGVGKSFFAKHFGKLFGRHYMMVSNSGHLVGNFNRHLEDLVVLFADEAFYAGDKKHQSILKTLVTEETLAIEAKGVDVRMSPNCIHLIMASNDDHVIPAGNDERRFFVLDAGSEKKQNTVYFAKIAEDMKTGGAENLLYYLQSMDLKGFDVRKVPQTDALRQQKLLSLSPFDDWWYNRLLDGDLLGEGEDWPEFVVKDRLKEAFLNHTNQFKAMNIRSLETMLGLNFRKVMPGEKPEQTTVLTPTSIQLENGSVVTKKLRKTAYILPTLDACRARWEELHGETEWPQPQREMKLAKAPRDDIPF